MLFKKTHLIALGLASSALMLAGCSKPPSCSDEQTTKSIHSMLDNRVKEIIPLVYGALANDDPQNIKDTYLQGLKVEISNVVSDGYNDQAKRYSCRGKLSVSTPSGGKYDRDIAYSTQRTEGKGSDFMVEVQAFDPFAGAVVKDLMADYFSKRFQGEWPGEYSCAGLDGATEGAQGPFSMPVTLVVDEHQRAKLERTTKGGGIEILSGQLIPSGLQLSGQGRNSPDDTWSTVFQGKIQGLDYSAEGVITAPDNHVLRKCSLKFKLPSRK